MTTIRERSTAALAEALHNPSACNMETHGAALHLDEVEWALAASPTLARRLDFATAWDEAVEALPEGTTLSLGAAAGSWVASYQHVHTACERCGVLHQCEDSGWVKGWGATPIDALVALTEALERQRDVARSIGVAETTVGSWVSGRKRRYGS